jgi:uncharacterized delta-60 repeat protein
MYDNDFSRYGITRLNSDGSLDMTFKPGIEVEDQIKAIAIQSDGKVIVAGDFWFRNSSNPKMNIARLNSDGSLDASFDPGTGTMRDIKNNRNGIIETMILQRDGKLIIGGDFTSYNGIGRNRIARILTSPTITELSASNSEAIFTIFPNPGKGIVTITVPILDSKVDVYSMAGEKVFSTTLSCHTTIVDLEKLDPGMYVVKMYHTNGVSIGKVILE